MQIDFQNFVADARLNRAIDSLKRANDIFDIILPNENQHSEILAWLFNPREGHGQGDAIFKDFLSAAYFSAEDNVFSNKEFFSTWTPSRISRTGFHSLIAKREYRLSNNGRLDLLLMDPVNKILVVVENKHGSRLGKTQLESYYEEVGALRQKSTFKEFLTAHIVLDRHYDGSGDEDGQRAPRNRWAFLDYQWLESGANRAELQFRRGNQSAGLVIAYCQKQSDYVAPAEKEIDDLLADIARDYSLVVPELAKASCTQISELKKNDLEGEFGELWIFANHYSELISRLQSKSKLAYIEAKLRRELPNRNFSTNYGPNRFWLYNEAWDCFTNEHFQYWPICVQGWEMERTNNGITKFGLGIQYRPHDIVEDRRADVQAALEEVFPELKKGRKNASYRILGKVADIDEASLINRTRALYLQLESVLAPLVS